ncbi:MULTISPECIES: class I SAM-dependent methyltransferase [unclassified Haladaptatus]|uniref:class I SAM-dependent methyltransferase n=1 Tax=unclassified Haladaptatus TaxID=2622732 RepID=UPI0023E76093|nr:MULTISPECIES: class I SAM-dependent methyltransferase [unclassified Haladaptatus]
MGFHTYDVDRADALEDDSRYRYVSVEELLGMIDPSSKMVVADLGSGTGFYTDHVAPYVGKVYAVDVQEAMHDIYREKGAPKNVEFVTAEIADLPFDDELLDVAFSTMTYHEFADDAALAEVHRVLRPDGKFVVADWSASGEGTDGPPVGERYSLADAKEHLEAAGFDLPFASERIETFVFVATKKKKN